MHITTNIFWTTPYYRKPFNSPEQIRTADLPVQGRTKLTPIPQDFKQMRDAAATAHDILKNYKQYRASDGREEIRTPGKLVKSQSPFLLATRPKVVERFELPMNGLQNRRINLTMLYDQIRV